MLLMLLLATLRLDAGAFPDDELFFVTGVSSNHFEESLALLYSIKKYHPCGVLLLYDLGLTIPQVTLLQSGRLMRNIEVIDLPDSAHTWHREFYHGEKAVKPLFVEDALRRMGNSRGGAGRAGSRRYMFYVDASIRLTKALDALALQTLHSRGILVSPKFVGHLQHQYTHPDMFVWFGFEFNKEKALCEGVTDQTMSTSKCMPQTHSGVFLVDTRNATIVEGVLQPWARCAKFKACIVPDGAYSFVTPKMRAKMPGRKLYTHRADQGSYSFLLDRIVGRGQQYRDFSLPVSVITYVQINRNGKEISAADLYKLPAEIC